MSISSIGGVSPQAAAYQPRSAAQGAEPVNSNDLELTTVTTHCNKQHKHGPSCPHSVSTSPDPGPGEPGSRLDKRA